MARLSEHDLPARWLSWATAGPLVVSCVLLVCVPGNMLIQEPDNGTLLLLAAAPRNWLADGQQIEVRRAPTCYGPLDMTVQSRAATGTIRANIELPERAQPNELLVRFRHPAGQRIQAVQVNGQGWSQFEPGKEWVRIARPDQRQYEIVASY